jgi:serine/threonine-protein kinase
MAVVFRAEDSTLGRQVAIKVMHAHLWGRAEYAARFSREARAVAALRHPNIVEIYDYSQGEGTEAGYIVSELVLGPTLRQFLDRIGRPLPEVAAMITLKLAEALQCAHARGIIHRDLKPENVIIAEGGRIVLTDFGIARIAEGEAVTQTGAMIGSPAYMSPEQARGDTIDPRADLFSLGAVLYLLGTGALPFAGKDPISTVLRVLEGTYEPPLKLNPQLGSPLDRIIRQLLQPDPEDRPASAQSVAANLRAALADAGIADPDQELREYFGAPGSYNKQLVSRIVTVSLTLAADAYRGKDYPRALSFCDRVLAFEPDHPGALELVARFGRRSPPWRRPSLWGALGAAAIGLAGATIYWGHLGRGTPPRPLPKAAGPTYVVAFPTADGGASPPVDRGIPDAVFPRAEDRGSPRRPTHQRRRHEPRRADASLPLALPHPDSRPSATQERPVPRPSHGELQVAIGPHCAVFVDGELRGESPMTGALKLAPGPHDVVCRQKETGAEVRRRVTIERGKLQRLEDHLPAGRVRLRLRRGDAVRIGGGDTHRSDFQLVPKRYDIELLQGGSPIERRWIAIPSQGCTLTDSPSLRCE